MVYKHKSSTFDFVADFDIQFFKWCYLRQKAIADLTVDENLRHNLYYYLFQSVFHYKNEYLQHLGSPKGPG